MNNFVIAASGPSLKRANMRAIQRSGWQVITVNNAWKRAPWAQYHYAGDAPWWAAYGDEALAGSQSVHYTRDRDTAIARGIRFIRVLEGHGLCTLPGILHKGGNSGFQAINLAFHLGARRIVLVGFDMSRAHGAHFDGDHPTGMLNAPEKHIECWRNMMQPMADDLRRHRVDVVNASAYTELTCFPRMPLAEALR